MAALVVGEPQAAEEREAALFGDRAMDMAMCLHSKLLGEVKDKPVYTDLPVTFPYPFIMAADPTHGDGNLDKPTFSVGVELESGPDVMVWVSVRQWEQDDRDFWTGCTLRVGAWLPDSPVKRKFTGTLHLTFIGYGAPTEDDTEEAMI